MTTKREITVREVQMIEMPIAVKDLAADRSAAISVRDRSAQGDHKYLANVSRGTAARAGQGSRPVEDWVRWTYAEQRAHQVDERMRLVGRPMGYASRDSVARTLEAGALGAVIHGAAAGCALHPDAELVHDQVMRLKELWRGLLIDYGITGVPPLGEACARPRWRVRKDERGRPIMLLDRNRHAIGCMVEPEVSDLTVLFWRRTYLEWWEALLMLAGRLREEGLRSCQELPAANPAPWELTI